MPGTFHCPPTTSVGICITSQSIDYPSSKYYFRLCYLEPLPQCTVTGQIVGEKVSETEIYMQEVYWGMFLDQNTCGRAREAIGAEGEVEQWYTCTTNFS